MGSEMCIRDSAYIVDAAIDFNLLFNSNYRCVSLPTYPFSKTRYWPMPGNSMGVTFDAPSIVTKAKVNELSSKDINKVHVWQENKKLSDFLITAIAKITKTSPKKLDSDENPFIQRTLVELGFDSLMVLTLRKEIYQQTNAKLQLEDFFTDNKISHVIQHIQQELNTKKEATVIPSEEVRL